MKYCVVILIFAALVKAGLSCSGCGGELILYNIVLYNNCHNAEFYAIIYVRINFPLSLLEVDRV